MSDTVWLITGCSTGFGRELATLAIARGDRVAVTARNKAQIADLAAAHPDRVKAIALDVTVQEQIDTAVAEVMTAFGRIDVLVNNAGYGYQASVEEGVDTEIRAMFDANVFGLFALTRAVLPIMRKQRRGRILNISSVAGLIGFMGSGYYAASKHAVEGWSSALAKEVAPLGIHVTCVEPGPFRTDWAGRSLKQTPVRIDDYADTVAARLAATHANSGQQKGDPVRAAHAMLDMVDHATPPEHLVLGQWGVEAVMEHLTQTLASVKAWQAVGEATDYPQ